MKTDEIKTFFQAVTSCPECGKLQSGSGNKVWCENTACLIHGQHFDINWKEQ